jgi:hypothetical protein
MKFVTTQVPYRAVAVETDDEGNPTRTVSNVPLKVSDADAEKYVKLGDELGVAIVVSDTDDAADLPAGTQPTPDLSAGVAAIHGTGEPVTTEIATGEDPPADQTTTTKKKGR